MLDNFYRFLAEHGVALTELSRSESFAITKQWTSIFAMEPESLRQTEGPKAVDKWMNVAAESNSLILLFLPSRIAAFPISENSRPCTVNRYAGPILDLSVYNDLEFAVCPETYDWTLVHTHEDGAFGGPFFIEGG